MASPGEITLVLTAIRAGDLSAKEKLVELVYNDLRKIAVSHLSRERQDHTLQATALVNETYLRLLGKDAAKWENTVHFFSAAASAMRNILVDHARAIRSAKRGGNRAKASLDDLNFGIDDRVEEILAVHEALGQLEKRSPRQKTIVEMRFYAGFTEDEIAEVLHMSVRQVKRDWATARSLLFGEISAKSKVQAH